VGCGEPRTERRYRERVPHIPGRSREPRGRPIMFRPPRLLPLVQLPPAASGVTGGGRPS
jgi:hypothetical protein